jgi:cobalt-zinc-cadmium efflux system outer membrane protein
MSLHHGPVPSWLILATLSGIAYGQDWTEAAVVERFLSQSPHVREARARVAITEAESRGKTLYTNPSFNYTRESAGFTEFFQAEQTLPITGRLGILRQAGSSAIRATEAERAFSLWQTRSSLRQAFYRVLASQNREAIYLAGLKEIDDVIRILLEREKQGEGSKFDRMRTERERAELLAESQLIRSITALERGQMLAFLPEGTSITKIRGSIDTKVILPATADLERRALTRREDYRAEQRRIEQFGLEQRAAERLRFPEPKINAGLKRADLGQPGFINGSTVNGPVVGITVPIPLFNKGQTEVARFSAEQERASARLQLLSQQIRAAVAASAEAFQVRLSALDEYTKELAGTGPELVRIATVAYQEGEIGILQLLDAYRVQRQAQIRMLDIQAAVKESQIELERVVGEEIVR